MIEPEPSMSAAAAASAVGPFDFLVARGRVEAATDSTAWLQALLDVEVALAHALGDACLADAAVVERVVAACDASTIDVERIFVGASGGGNPVIPLVAELGRRLDDDAAAVLHAGATSQDIVDTATSLVVRHAGSVMIDDLAATADRCASLADEHRATVMTGRTLLQQATPTTFGLVAAGWTTALDESCDRLADAIGRLPVQLGGPTGTLATYADRADDVVDAFAARLGLVVPVMPWHTRRHPITSIAAALGDVAASVESIATDVVLMAQTEIGELAELAEPTDSGLGGSSAMPHKQNPIAGVSARAAAKQAPGLVANLFAAAGGHELQRAAGAWHAEWPSLQSLLRATASAVSWLGACVERLHVDERRMRSNVDASGGLVMSAALADRLTEHVGRMRAHRLVEAAVRRTSVGGHRFGDEVRADDEIESALGSKAANVIADALDPASIIPGASGLVDRALAAHRRGDRPSADLIAESATARKPSSGSAPSSSEEPAES